MQLIADTTSAFCISHSPSTPVAEHVPACSPQSADDKPPDPDHEPSHLPKRLLLVVGCFGLDLGTEVALLALLWEDDGFVVGRIPILLGPSWLRIHEAVYVTTREESRKSPDPCEHANADGEEQDGHEDAETNADPEEGEAQGRDEGEAERRDGEAEKEDDGDEGEDEVEEDEALRVIGQRGQ